MPQHGNAYRPERMPAWFPNTPSSDYASMLLLRLHVQRYAAGESLSECVLRAWMPSLERGGRLAAFTLEACGHPFRWSASHPGNGLIEPACRSTSLLADGSQSFAIGNQHGCALERDQVLVLELAERARDSFTRGTYALRNLFMREGHAHLVAFGSLATFSRPVQEQ